MEIQRLIGRSLRSVVKLEALPEIQITVDCDVIQADGGTRCASIVGGYVALSDAIRRLSAERRVNENVLTGQCAAVSVGIVNDQCLLDLDYSEDSKAEVDMNVVMLNNGRFVEIQGTGEEASYSREQLDEMLSLAEHGIAQLLDLQLAATLEVPRPRSI